MLRRAGVLNAVEDTQRGVYVIPLTNRHDLTINFHSPLPTYYVIIFVVRSLTFFVAEMMYMHPFA